jgi:outer membrane cobalamin receptor
LGRVYPHCSIAGRPLWVIGCLQTTRLLSMIYRFINKFPLLATFPFAGLVNFSVAQDALPAEELAPLEIYADRLVQPTEFVSSNSGRTVANTLLGGARIGIQDLSEALEQYPGYAAFRTTPARAAHPTTQGVRLRNLGINSTSRSIVTLDDVPQNDPFGGWVYWQRYQPSALSSISIRPSSDSESWGNYGTGGRISMKSLRASDLGLHTKATIGSDGEREFSLFTNSKIDDQSSLSFSGILGDTDGFYTLRPDQRGSVDRKANSDVSSFSIGYDFEVEDLWRVEVNANRFEENRENGTPLAVNGTDATDVSASALRVFDGGNSGLKLIAYHQDRDFQNQFTSVADDRNSERPALNQFDVPASANGASIRYFTRIENTHDFSIGADFRDADGSVAEQFRNLGAGFTRLREAGGEQSFVGVFSTARLQLSGTTSLTGSLRLDDVEDRKGFRDEWNTENDTQIRNDAVPDRSETFFSNNLTLYHDFSDNLRGMIRQSSGFRAPTLNELYRPFRVKNDTIESNAGLVAEEHLGWEAGLRFSSDDDWFFSANIFHYSLDNMIANAVLSKESGFDPLCGFIPGGGSCGERRNIAESSVEGIEIDWQSRLSDTVSVRAQAVYAASDVQEASGLPTLIGNEFPHASPFKANLTLDWLPSDSVNIWSSLRYQSSEYEDLGNEQELEKIFQVDGGVRYAITGQHAVSLRIENLFDEEFETGISTDGLVSISAPRTVWLSWDFSR